VVGGGVALDEVAALALELPAVSEGTSYGNRAWKVGSKTFVWERPFSKADLARFGDEPVPHGSIVGVRMDDLDDTRAVLAAGVPGVFTIPHFDGYPAVLVQLEATDRDSIRQLLVDGWLSCAPARAREAFLAQENP
jgi:hypothetical protein